MNKKDVNFVYVDDKQKKIILDILGYAVNEKGFLINKKTKKEHICPITNTKVRVNYPHLKVWASAV